MPCDGKAVLKTFQTALCVVCLVFKIWTTTEGYRVGLSLQKMSREWDYHSFTAVGAPPTLLMDITFGGYTAVTLAFLLGRIAGDPVTIAERLLLVVGCVLMLGIASMLATWVDDVPRQLVDNTIVLAVLSLLTGILLLVDAGTKSLKMKMKPRKRREAKRAAVEEVRAAPEVAEVVKTEEEVKAMSAPPGGEEKETQTEERSGIRSVEIRIKDGHQGKQTASTVDVLQEGMLLQEGSAVKAAPPRQVPSFQGSPLRHTSSYYVHGGVPTPFAWHRLKDQQ